MQMLARTLLCAVAFFAAFALHAHAQNNSITKAFLTGRVNYTRDTSFTKVAPKYSGNTVYLKKETYSAYQKMYAAALKDGIQLHIISGTRSFNDQHYKWDSKWHDSEFAGIKNKKTKASKLLRWWSMPGTSRHHWGTDMDLVNMKPAYYQTKAGKKVYDWMTKNAAKFGFFQPFNAGRTTGYQEEKWHWSYLPLAKIYLKEYLRQVTYADINGFPGSEAAVELDVINSQVLAINPVGKPMAGSYTVAMNLPNGVRRTIGVATPVAQR